MSSDRLSASILLALGFGILTYYLEGSIIFSIGTILVVFGGIVLCLSKES